MFNVVPLKKIIPSRFRVHLPRARHGHKRAADKRSAPIILVSLVVAGTTTLGIDKSPRSLLEKLDNALLPYKYPWTAVKGDLEELKNRSKAASRHRTATLNKLETIDDIDLSPILTASTRPTSDAKRDFSNIDEASSLQSRIHDAAFLETPPPPAVYNTLPRAPDTPQHPILHLSLLHQSRRLPPAHLLLLLQHHLPRRSIPRPSQTTIQQHLPNPLLRLLQPRRLGPLLRQRGRVQRRCGRTRCLLSHWRSM